MRAYCPHCGARLTPAHTRDTGAATERPDDACPILWARRNPLPRHTATETETEEKELTNA